MRWPDIPGNEEAFEALVERLASKEAIAFVGAGASVPMYPLWEGLIERLAEAACGRQPKAERAARKAYWLKQAKSQPALTASQIRQQLGDGRYHDLLRETFLPRSERSYTKTHERLVGLPFRAFVTLNFDLGLSHARLGGLPPFSWRSTNVSRWLNNRLDGSPPIFHAHGLVSEIDSVVLDLESYDTAYARPPFRQLMEQLWRGGQLVIIGFGFADPPLREMVHRIVEESGAPEVVAPGHVAVIGLDAGELAVADLKRDEIERLYHSQALFYPVRRMADGTPDHSALHEVLARATARLSARPEPAPPATETIGPPSAAPPATDVEALWRQAVQRQHRQLYNLLDLPAGLDVLEEAYVEVGVRGGEALERQGAHGDGRRLEELLRLAPGQHPWVTGRWLLVGDPGSGKTTQLRRLAARFAAGGPGSPLPVFRPLRAALEAQRFLLDDLAESFERTDGVGGLRRLFDRAGDEGRLVLFLDGLDEVPRERHGEVGELAAALVARFPRSRMVITTRPHGRSELAGDFVELKLLPLSDESRGEFLEKWLRHHGSSDPPAETARALDHFATDRALDELSRVPLYLTLLAGLWDEAAPTPRRTSQLFERIFAYLYEGRHHRPEERRPIASSADVHRALAYLAYGMTREELAEETRAGLERRLTRPEAAAVRGPLVATWPEGLWAFFFDVWERTQILGPHGDPDAPTARRDDAGPWSFWHRTFREYLVAEELGELHRRRGSEALLELVTGVPGGSGVRSEPERPGRLSALFARLFRPGTAEPPAAAARIVTDVRGDPGRWAEPLALLAGRLGPGPGDELVQALAKANPSVGRRALAASQGLSAETLRTVLALSDEWEERRKVFEEIPDQLAEPDEALNLIDQLRRQTRNGNDLYFLDRAAKTVGEKRSDRADAAARLRARLHDHIPVSDEVGRLFASFETAAGERKPLWREIPAGRGWIGSKEGEGHKDERPRHEVEVVAPSWLAAVPVTRAQYRAFDPEKAFPAVEGVPERELALHPAVRVTWYEAVAFCRWLAAQLGLGGARLPTEEEWEVACRAKTTTRYCSGDQEKQLAEVGWYSGNSGRRTHRVAEKAPNGWGLYDVHGNVWEWTASEWDGKKYGGRRGSDLFPIDPRPEPADLAASPGAGRVLRGGSYWSDADDARSAFRNRRFPEVGDVNQGFRVLLPFPPEILDH